MVKLAHGRAGVAAPRWQRGFTMLEVLISVLVISLGLLGFAGLQAVSIKANNTAHQRSMATILAYDIVDRMRANRPAAIAGSYNFALGAGGAGGGGVVGTDIGELINEVSDALPGGQAGVAVTADGSATIQIQWTGQDDKDGNGQPDLVLFTTQTKI